MFWTAYPPFNSGESRRKPIFKFNVFTTHGYLFFRLCTPLDGDTGALSWSFIRTVNEGVYGTWVMALLGIISLFVWERIPWAGIFRIFLIRCGEGVFLVRQDEDAPSLEGGLVRSH